MSEDDSYPYFPFYPKDFTSDGLVEAMSTEEVGAYILLLCRSWREVPRGSLPTDDRILAKWARLDADHWAVAKAAVMAAFTSGTDGRVHQKRLRREWEKLQTLKTKRVAIAEKAAKKRWDMHDACFKHAIISDSSFAVNSGSFAVSGGSGGKVCDAATKLFLEYPRRDGSKTLAIPAIASALMKYSFSCLQRAIQRYSDEVVNDDEQFIYKPEKFFGRQIFLEYIVDNFVPKPPKIQKEVKHNGHRNGLQTIRPEN